MNETCFFHKMQDGTMHNIYRCEPENPTEIKGIVQLVHGSCEHSARYREFAEYLTSNGYIMIANDLRGHGQTAKKEEDLGFIAHDDGWYKLIGDLLEVNHLIKQDYPGSKIIMIGHSMGSFLARHYALIYSETIDGLIAIGTAHQSKLELTAGILVAKLCMKFKGNRSKGEFLNKLTYERFNKHLEAPLTKSDWITHDRSVVDDFIADERCGFIFSNSAFRDMFTGLLFITDRYHIENGPRQLPILLLSGAQDPVSNNGIQVKKAYQEYKAAGVEKIDMTLYPNMRHEILNELDKNLVYADIVNWMETITP